MTGRRSPGRLSALNGVVHQGNAERQFGRKKAIEIRQMYRFLEELELPDEGVLVPGETPDFTYETAGRRIGIEIRTLFDNRPVEEAARRERIVTEAQRLVADDTRFDGLRLLVAFGNAPLPTIKEGAEKLVRQVCGLVPRRTFTRIEQDRSYLFRTISFFSKRQRREMAGSREGRVS